MAACGVPDADRSAANAHSILGGSSGGSPATDGGPDDPEGVPPDAGGGVDACAPIRIHDCDTTPGFGTELTTYTPGGAPELNIVGIYTTTRHDEGPAVFRPFAVHVEAGGPMILVVSAYDPTHWTITADAAAMIERILVIGWEVQTAEGPPSIPIELHYDGPSEFGANGHDWPHDTADLFLSAETLAGRDVTAFAGCYSATRATVGACGCPPVGCEAPTALTVECGGPGGTEGSDPAIQAWLDSVVTSGGCGVASVTSDAPALFPASCAGAPVPTVVTFTATDEQGNSAECSSTVTVLDRIPPAVALTQTAACLWPPNNELVDVATVVVSDACDPEPVVESVVATSDETTATERGAGGPSHCPDATFEGGAVRLRAERAGPSGADNGRVYGAVGLTASDACGNEGSASLSAGTVAGCPGAVCVPHDHDGQECGAVDDGQHDATVCN